MWQAFSLKGLSVKGPALTHPFSNVIPSKRPPLKPAHDTKAALLPSRTTVWEGPRGLSPERSKQQV